MSASIVARFDAEFGRTDPRAVFSNWASYYFKTVLPPLLTANIMLDRVPRVDLDQVAFVIAPNLRVHVLKVGGDVADLRPYDAHGRFDSLVMTHLTPFIDLVARRSGVTERVLWSNAGTVFDTFLGMIESLAAGWPGLAQARAFLASPTRLNGGQNPLHQPVRRIKGRRVPGVTHEDPFHESAAWVKPPRF